MKDVIFRVGISLQEFFALEISLQDIFFPKLPHGLLSMITHTSPQKSNGRPLN